MPHHNPIYCIGDSHVSFFSGKDKIQPLWPKPSDDVLPYFKTFRLGPILAHSLSKYGSTMKGRELLFVLLDRGISVSEREIPPESKVLLCFGEIDCRAHLSKQAQRQKREVSSVVSESVERYFSAILEVDNLGYDILVWNVIPSTKSIMRNTNNFPTLGTCAERNHISQLFNSYLETLCNFHDIKFISIFDDLVDKNGLTRMEYYKDQIHLSQKAMPLVLSKMNEIFVYDFVDSHISSELKKNKKSDFVHAQKVGSSLLHICKSLIRRE